MDDVTNGSNVENKSVTPSRSGRKPKLWLLPVLMAVVLVLGGTALLWDARTQAAQKFDMVREAPIVPQGRDRGEATQVANLAGDPQGHMFLLEFSSDGFPGRLQRFDEKNSADALVYKSRKKGQDLTDPVDVDCDAKGGITVLLQDGRLQLLDNNLNYLRTIQTKIVKGTAASVDSLGQIYVADQRANKVAIFDNNGRRVGELNVAAGAGDSLIYPSLLRVTPNDEIVVVEKTPAGLRARIFAKDHSLRLTFLLGKIADSPWIRIGVNAQDKMFVNDTMGALGMAVWDLESGKYFGAASQTKDGVQFVSPGCIGADRFTPDVYVHTVPGLVKCALPKANS